ncbi:PREDICTED: adenylyl-sulfate kinase 2, chloroplastic [Tarenaya hassleriana]|uniref:adenylyl-sulfate kinase 2, chloroplastic n=1 Tax=Tarenaya hassleriana TaxID=28532 RepID=UPI00053C4B55|nr:PREDICTED: adenylyl-sulfate kinase 2, chloroplastic [Tarenaya hassleriana]
MEGLAIGASRPSISCSLQGFGGSERSQPSTVRLPPANVADNPKLVAKSTSVLPISAVNVSANASLTADFPALSDEKVAETGTKRKSSNIVWHESSICRCDRQQLLQQKGCVIWITGLSGSGKSTVACALSKALYERGKLTYTLDGDNVRHGLNRDLTFKAEDRTENIRRIGEVAKLFADVGVICIASLISPYRRDRDSCRSLLPEGDFIEVFMDVPLQVCEARDPKGLYKLARAGKIKGFTGIDDPYEPPLDCEIVLKHTGDNYSSSPRKMAETIISYLESKGYLRG